MSILRYKDPNTGQWRTIGGLYADHIGENIDLSITGAAVGQTVSIAEVDEDGAPVKWMAVDFPNESNGAGKFVVKVTATFVDNKEVYSTDKTSFDITEAWLRNEIISCEYGDPLDFPIILQPVFLTGAYALFSGVWTESQIFVMIEDSEVSVNFAKVITEEYAESVLSDYAKTTDVPTDEHIKALIDEKLESIPNSNCENAMYVFVDKNINGVITVDKTNSEIWNAFIESRAIFCVYTDGDSVPIVAPIVSGNESSAEFSITINLNGLMFSFHISIVDDVATVLKNSKTIVSSVNGIIPDDYGNVQITIPDSSVGTDSTHCFIVQDTAPEDTSVLWIDTMDDTEDEPINVDENGSVLYVNVTEDENGTVTADKTNTEIWNAILENRAVSCVYTVPNNGTFYVPLVSGYEDAADFSLTLKFDNFEYSFGISITSDGATVIKDSKPIYDGIPVSGATVGQTVKITEVDESGKPTAWEAVDFPSGEGGGSDTGTKEWEEFMRFTVDNAETSVFDFSFNGVETLESKKVKEFYLYSPIQNSNGADATASILINNQINITGLNTFQRSAGGYLKLGVFALSDYLSLYYFGRDTVIGNGPGGITKNVDLVENNGILEGNMGAKNAYICFSKFKDGIMFPLLREDYIETITISLSAPCNNGIEFIVYVR